VTVTRAENSRAVKPVPGVTYTRNSVGRFRTIAVRIAGSIGVTPLLSGTLMVWNAATSWMRRSRGSPLQPSAPSGARQVPAMHASPTSHALPHIPQCSELSCRSAHSPSHSVWPAGHTHLLASHSFPVAHGASHMPQ
jgi:hypothetical protein